MKGLVIVHECFEDVAAREVKELIKAEPAINKCAVTFSVKKYEDLCKLAYLGQSFTRVLLLLDEFRQKDFSKEIPVRIKKINLKKWIKKGKSFAVNSEKNLEGGILRSEMEAETGDAIISSRNGFKPKVDLENPDTTLFVFMTEPKTYIGIDFTGFDLSKREYKIFTHPASLKGTTAFFLAGHSGYKKNMVLIDPFCGSGTIPIEAALYSKGMSANHYSKDKFAFRKLDLMIDFDKFFKKIDSKIKEPDKKINGFDYQLRHVKASKKNAKIAGVNKSINFSMVDVEWLDTKFKKGTVDLIVTNPPQISKNTNVKEIAKLYDELFYQAEFILKKKGKVVLFTSHTKKMIEAAEKHNFTLKISKELTFGDEHRHVLTFTH